MSFDLQNYLNELSEAIAARLREDLNSDASRIQPEWLGIADGAIYSGLSEETLRKLGASGKIQFRRPVRGRVLISRRELDDYIRSSTSTPRSGRGR